MPKWFCIFSTICKMYLVFWQVFLHVGMYSMYVQPAIVCVWVCLHICVGVCAFMCVCWWSCMCMYVCGSVCVQHLCLSSSSSKVTVFSLVLWMSVFLFPLQRTLSVITTGPVAWMISSSILSLVWIAHNLAMKRGACWIISRIPFPIVLWQNKAVQDNVSVCVYMCVCVCVCTFYLFCITHNCIQFFSLNQRWRREVHSCQIPIATKDACRCTHDHHYHHSHHIYTLPLKPPHMSPFCSLLAMQHCDSPRYIPSLFLNKQRRYISHTGYDDVSEELDQMMTSRWDCTDNRLIKAFPHHISSLSPGALTH